MKKILLIVLVLIVGCAEESINLEALNERDDVFYAINTNEPYTGAVFELYENGEKSVEGYLKDGKEDGKWISYSENGKIRTETNKKDGLRVKITYYNEDGSIESVKEW